MAALNKGQRNSDRKILREILLLHFLWLFSLWSPEMCKAVQCARCAVVSRDPTRYGDALGITPEVWAEGHTCPSCFPVGSSSPAPPMVPLWFRQLHFLALAFLVLLQLSKSCFCLRILVNGIKQKSSLVSNLHTLHQGKKVNETHRQQTACLKSSAGLK